MKKEFLEPEFSGLFDNNLFLFHIKSSELHSIEIDENSSYVDRMTNEVNYRKYKIEKNLFLITLKEERKNEKR